MARQFRTPQFRSILESAEWGPRASGSGNSGAIIGAIRGRERDKHQQSLAEMEFQERETARLIEAKQARKDERRQVALDKQAGQKHMLAQKTGSQALKEKVQASEQSNKLMFDKEMMGAVNRIKKVEQSGNSQLIQSVREAEYDKMLNAAKLYGIDLSDTGASVSSETLPEPAISTMDAADMGLSQRDLTDREAMLGASQRQPGDYLDNTPDPDQLRKSISQRDRESGAFGEFSPAEREAAAIIASRDKGKGWDNPRAAMDHPDWAETYNSVLGDHLKKGQTNVDVRIENPTGGELTRQQKRWAGHKQTLRAADRILMYSGGSYDHNTGRITGDDFDKTFGWLARTKHTYNDLKSNLVPLEGEAAEHFNKMTKIRNEVEALDAVKVHEYFGGALTKTEVDRLKNLILDKDASGDVIRANLETLYMRINDAMEIDEELVRGDYFNKNNVPRGGVMHKAKMEERLEQAAKSRARRNKTVERLDAEDMLKALQSTGG